MTLIIGCDPGAKGAIAFLADGKIEAVFDMPADEVKVGGKLRSRVSAARLAALLLFPRADHVYIENVNARPMEGAAGAFAFGKACGVLEGVCAALGLPCTLITPAEWKRAIRCPADKGAARKRACELFPASAAMFARVRDDGRAESAMLALYGEQLQRGVRAPTV